MEKAFSTFHWGPIAQRPIQKSNIWVRSICRSILVFIHKLFVYHFDFYIIENDRMSFMAKYRKEILLLLGFLIASLIVSSEVIAQNRSPYIYGKITTYSGDYQGQIRWGG